MCVQCQTAQGPNNFFREQSVRYTDLAKVTDKDDSHASEGVTGWEIWFALARSAQSVRDDGEHGCVDHGGLVNNDAHDVVRHLLDQL